MTDEYDDPLLSSRHFHHRSGRRAGGEASSTAFDVKKTFGSYSIQIGKASSKKSKNADSNANDGGMELWRLSDDGLAVIGQLKLQDKLDANVVLAASRKSMKVVLNNLRETSRASTSGDAEEEQAGPGEATPTNNAEIDSDVAENDDDGSEVSGSDEDANDEAASPNRFATFEKNSFRSPKFWIAWQGRALSSPAAPGSSTPLFPDEERNSGYIVFSNDCKKFDATLTTPSLEWKNQKLRGWKLKSVAERHDEFVWR